MSLDGKTRILDAARTVIGRNGIAGATVRVIAEEAGLSTGAIYHYYKSKEEILYDIMDYNLSESTKIAQESKLGITPKEEILDKILENVKIRFDMEEESRIKFYLAQEAMVGNEELAIKFKQKYEEWIGGTEELLLYLYGNPTSESDKVRVKAIASLLIAGIDGTVTQLILKANISKKEETIELYCDIMRKALPTFFDTLEKEVK